MRRPVRTSRVREALWWITSRRPACCTDTWLRNTSRTIRPMCCVDRLKLQLQRVISLAGPAVDDPRLITLPVGAAIDEVVAGELNDEGARVISGSFLSGHIAVGTEAYLGRHHRQITALPEANQESLSPWRTAVFDTALEQGLRLQCADSFSTFDFRRRLVNGVLTGCGNARRHAGPAQPFTISLPNVRIGKVLVMRNRLRKLIPSSGFSPSASSSMKLTALPAGEGVARSTVIFGNDTQPAYRISGHGRAQAPLTVLAPARPLRRSHHRENEHTGQGAASRRLVGVPARPG